jgi:cellobiose phosphorylase
MKIKNSLGLSFDFLENGIVRSIEVDPVRISLNTATRFSRSGATLYLRNRTKPFEYTALVGPGSNSRFTINDHVFLAQGDWKGLEYKCILQLSAKSLSWQWNIEVVNRSGNPVEFDLIYVQDAGLKPISDGLVNEYYVSQYIERRILEDQSHGPVICCRQNMKESVGNPWLMIACRNKAIAGSVDGMQFYGKTYRETGIPEGLLTDRLGGEYAGESSVLALQESSVTLVDGDTHKSAFFGTCLPDHPDATSENDLTRLDDLFSGFSDDVSFEISGEPIAPVENLFITSGFLPVDDLNEQDFDTYFPSDRRHYEYENGRLMSFFCTPGNHVVLRAKEIRVDRPHAHIMQAMAGFVPDEDIMSTTSFAFGVFNSHLTQGNTNFNVLLSVCRSPFNLSPETGQRIFVEMNDRKFLLGIPSAFEMGLNHFRWIYKHKDFCFQVRTWTSKTSPQVNMDFKVLKGNPVKLLITHDFDPLNGWQIEPGTKEIDYIARPSDGNMIKNKFPNAKFRIIVNSNNVDYMVGAEEMLYSDKKSHQESLFVISVKETSDFCLSFIGEVNSYVQPVKIETADEQFASDCRDAQSIWQDLCLNLSMKGAHEDIAAIQEILPWYGMNALTHYLTPYGLEQFSGAAWGTRDVAQGPIDLLLSMEKYEQARQVLRIIFSNQNPDGGWPQWWMFDSYSDIRADSSHGDVYYWCMIALSNYIRITGDLKILDELLPYFHKGGAQPEIKPLTEHIERLIGMIVKSFIPGTTLVPFGGGDWNDSLQPVSRELAERMISSWTVEMNYQAFNQYRLVYELTGNTDKAKELKEICERIQMDFNKYLIKDGVVAGYGLVEEDGSIALLLHPGDNRTGIHYSILPMDRGIISEIFTKEQAAFHQDLIEKYLKGPDGARLMDRPLKYNGGIQKLFQRAESSTYFGREIGLMYMHEHIRYAESQARTGRADAFLKALRQANPVAYRDIVSCSDIRQSNCYYTSSDVVFRDRYEADERYDEIKSGKLTLKGGWRVYSSGPGIYIDLIVSRLLGLRINLGKLIIDPVIPPTLDGLTASLTLLHHAVTLKYEVKEGCFSPKAISVNGNLVTFSYEVNKYRRGGAEIPVNQLVTMLDRDDNMIEIRL